MDNNIKDVNFEEIHETKPIRGKALYYSTSQVATILGQPDSKIRYYTTVFDDILKIEFSNKQRRYTEQDISKLKFILELKEENMTIKQIQEYCQNIDFDNNNTEIKIKETNPLQIQALAKALLEEQNKQLMEFKETLISELDGKLMEQLELLVTKNNENSESNKEIIAITVDEIVSERLDEKLNILDTKLQELKSTLNTQEQEATKRDNEMIEYLKQHMEERKKENELQLQQQKKGFFSRLFGK